MDNNRTDRWFSNIQDNIHQIINDNIDNYFTETPDPLSGNTSPETIDYPIRQQVIHTLRDIIRLENNNINNYNSVIRDYSRNMRESVALLQRITDYDISRQPHIPTPRIRTRSNTTRQANPRQANPRQANPRQANPLQYPPRVQRPSIHRQYPDYNIFSHLLRPTTNTNNWTNIFQDVPIQPTPAQIENASETLIYNESLGLINTQCPITLGLFQEGEQIRRIIHCGHTFSAESFMNWFENNVQCPICRFDIRTAVSTQDDETQDNEEHSDTIHNDDVSGNATQSYTNPIGTTESFTFTDASINNIITNPIEVLIQSALGIDMSNNIGENFSQYIMSNLDISNNYTGFMNIPFQAETFTDASNNH